MFFSRYHHVSWFNDHFLAGLHNPCFALRQVGGLPRCFQDSPTTEDALGVLPGQQRGCTKIHRKNDGMTNNDGLTNKHDGVTLMVKPANNDGLKEDMNELSKHDPS